MIAGFLLGIFAALAIPGAFAAGYHCGRMDAR